MVHASGPELHPLARRFHRLTPEQVFLAVQVDGRRCTRRFVALNSYENRVYQLELEDGTPIVAKFYRPGRWSREAILAEHQFLTELAAQGVPVVCPFDLGGGETIGTVEEIFYSVFPRAPGRAPQELNDRELVTVGRILARIHNVGAAFEAKERPQLTPETYGENNLGYLVQNGLVHESARTAYVATVEALLSRIRPLFERVSRIRIHGDCHLGNLLWDQKGPVFLDFDDMLMGPPVQDVWMLCPSADDEGKRQRDVLLSGYQEVRKFEHETLRLVEPLRALRFIHYSTWIAKRWQDPAFQRTFGHFGTQQYWQREVSDLREQIARIDTVLGWN